MNTALTRQLPVRVAAVLAVTILMLATLAVGLTYSFAARHAVTAANGVLHASTISPHQDGDINADGIQGSG